MTGILAACTDCGVTFLVRDPSYSSDRPAASYTCPECGEANAEVVEVRPEPEYDPMNRIEAQERREERRGGP